MTEDTHHQQASDPATAGGNNADLDNTATELCFFFRYYMVEFFQDLLGPEGGVSRRLVEKNSALTISINFFFFQC